MIGSWYVGVVGPLSSPSGRRVRTTHLIKWKSVDSDSPIPGNDALGGIVMGNGDYCRSIDKICPWPNLPLFSARQVAPYFLIISFLKKNKMK